MVNRNVDIYHPGIQPFPPKDITFNLECQFTPFAYLKNLLESLIQEDLVIVST